MSPCGPCWCSAAKVSDEQCMHVPFPLLKSFCDLGTEECGAVKFLSSPPSLGMCFNWLSRRNEDLDGSLHYALRRRCNRRQISRELRARSHHQLAFDTPCHAPQHEMASDSVFGFFGLINPTTATCVPGSSQPSPAIEMYLGRSRTRLRRGRIVVNCRGICIVDVLRFATSDACLRNILCVCGTLSPKGQKCGRTSWRLLFCTFCA